jgi:hypothetical protein
MPDYLKQGYIKFTNTIIKSPAEQTRTIIKQLLIKMGTIIHLPSGNGTSILDTIITLEFRISNIKDAC